MGLSSAFIGAAIDWLRMRRLPDPNNGRLPGCLMLMVGALGFLGLVMFMITWVIGRPRISIISGAGVIVGFFLMFVLLAVIWVMREYLGAKKLEQE